MTMPTTDGNYPPDEMIPPALKPLFAAHRDLTNRLKALDERLVTEFSDEKEREAVRADQEARQEAVRSGKSASAVASRNLDAFNAAKAAATLDRDTLIDVHQQSQNGIVSAIWDGVMKDPKQTGADKIAPARAKYAKSVEAMIKARAEFTATTSLIDFLNDVCLGEFSYGPRARPAAYRAMGRQLPLPSFPHHNDPVSPHPLSTINGIANHLARDVAETAKELES